MTASTEGSPNRTQSQSEPRHSIGGTAPERDKAKDVKPIPRWRVKNRTGPAPQLGDCVAHVASNHRTLSGVYISTESRMARLRASPPMATTLPSGSSVAVWSLRESNILPA